MPSVRQVCSRSIFALPLVGMGAWGMLAIWFQSPLPETTRSMLAAGYLLALILAGVSIIFRSKRRFTVPIAYLAFLSVLSWWTGIQPSDMRDWAPEFAKRAIVAVKKDEIEVKNVRNFSWSSETQAEQHWENRNYRLSQLRTVDLFLTHWNKSSPEQAIASFGFLDGRQVAFAVEIRHKRHEVYSPIAALFRQYELTLVAADEADIIKLRTNLRGEDVYRYRLDVAPEQARQLFLKYVDLSRDLDRGPQFYNSLARSRTSMPFAMLKELTGNGYTLDFGGLAASYGPEYLYDNGLVARNASLREVKSKARITLQARAAEGSTDFAQAIRQGWGPEDAPRGHVVLR